MAKAKNDAPGMKGQRGRNEDGPLRQKRSDTSGKKLNDTYGTNFPNNTTLGDLREKFRTDSIKEIIEKGRGK